MTSEPLLHNCKYFMNNFLIIVGFFFILSNTASAANLSLLSTERFMAIKFPIKARFTLSASYKKVSTVKLTGQLNRDKHRTCLRDVHINLGILIVWTASVIVATSKWYSEVFYNNGAYHL